VDVELGAPIHVYVEARAALALIIKVAGAARGSHVVRNFPVLDNRFAARAVKVSHFPLLLPVMLLNVPGLLALIGLTDAFSSP
jgi:hypothetical protein